MVPGLEDLPPIVQGAVGLGIAAFIAWKAVQRYSTGQEIGKREHLDVSGQSFAITGGTLTDNGPMVKELAKLVEQQKRCAEALEKVCAIQERICNIMRETATEEEIERRVHERMERGKR